MSTRLIHPEQQPPVERSGLAGRAWPKSVARSELGTARMVVNTEARRALLCMITQRFFTLFSVVLLAVAVTSCRSLAERTKAECADNMRKVWLGASFYCLENKKSPETLVTPAEMVEYFSNHKAPRCPLGKVDYPAFTVAAGPRCPHRPELHTPPKRLTK